MASMQTTAVRSPPLAARILWAGFLSVVSTGVSLLGLGRTLSGNEIWALYWDAQPLHEQMQVLRFDVVHPPLAYLAQRVWLRVFGQGDTAVKMFPVLVSLAAITLFTWLAADVTAHWRVASFLFSSIYFQVGGDATQIRMYGLVLLLTVAGILLWRRWCEQPTNTRLAAWAVCMVLLVNTHLCGALTVVAFVLVNWLFGQRRVAFTLAAAGVALAMLPWLIYVFSAYRSRRLTQPVAGHALRGLAESPLIFIGTPPLPISGRLLAVAGCLLFLAMGLAARRALATSWQALKDKRNEPDARWLATAFVLAGVPTFALILVSVALVPVIAISGNFEFNARYVIGVVPSMWLALVLLGQSVGRGARALLYAGFLPWVLVSAAGTVAQSRIPSNARQAATVLAQEVRAKDLIVCDSIAAGDQFDWEWRHRLGRSGRIAILKQEGDPFEFPGPPAIVLSSLDLRDTDRVWFFLAPEDPFAVDVSKVKAFFSARGYVLQSGVPGSTPFVLPFRKSDGATAFVKSRLGTLRTRVGRTRKL
jgi:hypothetical protein